MSTTKGRGLAGTGRLHASGGCLGPMSLEVTVEPAEAGVRVLVEDRWRPGAQQPIRTEAVVDDEVFGQLVERVRAVLARDPVPPTHATSAMGVCVDLPLHEGSLQASAHECVEGLPVAPLLEAIHSFVGDAKLAPGARTEGPPPGAQTLTVWSRVRHRLRWLLWLLAWCGFFVAFGLVWRACVWLRAGH